MHARIDAKVWLYESMVRESCVSVWGHRTYLHLDLKQFPILLLMVSRVYELPVEWCEWCEGRVCMCTYSYARVFLHGEGESEN